MVQQLSLVFAAVVLLGYMGLYQSHARFLCWTNWFNRDKPTGTGDYEDLLSLQKAFPGQICSRPADIEAQTADDEVLAERTHQQFYAYNTRLGFICRNKDQKNERCFDYEVRFKCPCG
ncbi:cartilage intermediate layer protein 2 [Nematolebias whitei]|uniref:cartilage intermediate layer protein 2 n=1 Tax=Nematolebias whitei TaxID=451745 RepID=UPI001897E67C|nr:cartilage intermediate layer protein 2 [Nematolebias whitei]